MATKRKSISKKVRFEVFKRDSFKCQYCGKASPDVILHVDHLKPVSKGGENEIYNLITACSDCNGGKGATELDDNSSLQKQRQQLEELNTRREQLDMMLKWRNGLNDLTEAGIAVIMNAWNQAVGGDWCLNESGEREAKKLIRKYGVSSVVEAIDVAVDKYLRYELDLPVTESVGEAWGAVAKICQFRSKPKFIQDLYYIRGIMRNRFYYVNENEALRMLEDAYRSGIEIETLKSIAKSERNWSGWVGAMNEVMEAGE